MYGCPESTTKSLLHIFVRFVGWQAPNSIEGDLEALVEEHRIIHPTLAGQVEQRTSEKWWLLSLPFL